MNYNLKKFLLYIDTQGDAEYRIGSQCYSDSACHEIMLDVTGSNTVTVDVIRGPVQIRRMEFNGVEIADINACAIWVDDSGQAQKTHGQSGLLGKFIIRLHGNVVSHNYLNYLFSLTTV